MQGTIKELIEKGLTVNGVKVDAAMISVLVRCDIGIYVGEGPKPARGKCPAIYRFTPTETVEFNAEESEN